MKVLFWIFEIPLLLLFVVGFAAWWLNPATFWWAAIVAVGLSYLAFAFLFFGGFAFGMGYKGLGWFHVLLLIFYAIRIFPPSFFEKAKPQVQDLKLLNYNIAQHPLYTEAEASVFRKQLEALINEYHLTEIDGMVLNEQGGMWIQGEYQPSFSTRILAEQGFDIAIPPKIMERRVSQSVLFKPKYGVKATKAVYEPKEYRTIYYRVEFIYQGKKAAMYALHLASLGGKKPWNERKTKISSKKTWIEYIRQYRRAYAIHVKEVIQIKRALKEEKLPYLLIGDLNATMHNWEYRHLAKGLQDVYLAKGKGWGGTYRNDFPLVRIDFILASKEWLPVSSTTLSSDFSDHLAVLGRLRWRK